MEGGRLEQVTKENNHGIRRENMLAFASEMVKKKDVEAKCLPPYRP